MTYQNDIEYLQSISRITSKNILKVIEERETFITNNRNKIDPDIEANLVSLANSKDMSNIELFFQLMSGMGFEPRDCLLGFIHFLDMPFVAYTLGYQYLKGNLIDTLGFDFDISYQQRAFDFYYWELEQCMVHVEIPWKLTSKPPDIEVREIFNGRFKRKIIKELKKLKWKTKH